MARSRSFNVSVKMKVSGSLWRLAPFLPGPYAATKDQSETMPKNKRSRAPKESAGEYFHTEYDEIIKDASKDDVAELAKQMFKELWKCNKNKAKDFTRTLKRERERQRRLESERNFAMAGHWAYCWEDGAFGCPGRPFWCEDYELDGVDEDLYDDDQEVDVPTLEIDEWYRLTLWDEYMECDRIGDIVPENSNPKNDAGPLVYKVRYDFWRDYDNGECYEHEQDVTVTIEYDENTDSIRGNVKAVPVTENVNDCHPFCKDGAEFSFVGRRKRGRPCHLDLPAIYR